VKKTVKQVTLDSVIPVINDDVDIFVTSIEFRELKAKVNKLERYYHSNYKYIKLLWTKIDELEKSKNVTS
jgi:hypothetical protein